MIKLAIASALLLSAGAASAYDYYGVLSGSQEVPANGSTATGKGLITLSGDILDVYLTFSGVSAPLAAGHIHCCSPVGVNSGVALEFVVPATTSGVIDQSFDLSLDSTYTGGFLAGSGGTAALAKARLLTAFNEERAYFNIHNSVFPGGEIRGQISAVPEPASWAMMIAGFGIVGTAARRRRQLQTA